MDLYNKIQEAQAFVRGRTQQPVEVALVLGSGLGSLADSVENAVHHQGGRLTAGADRHHA